VCLRFLEWLNCWLEVIVVVLDFGLWKNWGSVEYYGFVARVFEIPSIWIMDWTYCYSFEFLGLGRIEGGVKYCGFVVDFIVMCICDWDFEFSDLYYC
jgi:hypothetical protein